MPYGFNEDKSKYDLENILKWPSDDTSQFTFTNGNRGTFRVIHAFKLGPLLFISGSFTPNAAIQRDVSITLFTGSNYWSGLIASDVLAGNVPGNKNGYAFATTPLQANRSYGLSALMFDPVL